MKISSSMASVCRNTELDTAFSLFHDAGFDSVDFPFNVYSSQPDAPLLADDWRQWVREVSALSQRYALPVTQAHATWSQSIPDDFHYESPLDVYRRTFEACRMLDCRQLIFHPLRHTGRIATQPLRQRIHDWNVRWFCELAAMAEQFDAMVNLENTFDSHHTQLSGDPLYPYTTAQDMRALLLDIGSTHVSLCLDTGHANISGQDIPAMIRLYGSDLKTVHLNDNYGNIRPVYEDLHLFPGYGAIEWKPIFAALREVVFAGVINMEPIAELKRMPNSIRLVQLRAAADTLRLLAEA